MKKVFYILTIILAFQLAKAQTPLTEAVDFQKVDIHGETIDLFEILDNGQHVIIDFFFCDCVPCQGITPYINQSYNDFGCNSGDVFFMSISGIIEDTNEDCLAYDELYGVEYPTISGAEGEGFKVAGQYQIGSYPTVILIAPNHNILEQHIWPIANVNDMNTPILNAGCEFKECPSTDIVDNNYNSFKIFPNPSNGQFYIEFSKPGNKSIKIIDLAGKVLHQMNIDDSDNIFYFDTCLAEGIYFIQITEGSLAYTERLSIIY